jgi:hypothetical protein
MKPIDTNTRLPIQHERVLAYYPERGWQFATLTDEDTFLPDGEVTHWMPVPDAPSTRRRKGYTPDFEQAFRMYDRKGSKAKAFKYWQMLSEDDRKSILKAIVPYCQRYSGADFQFRKDFDGWINPDERRWERPTQDPRGAVTPTPSFGWSAPR